MDVIIHPVAWAGWAGLLVTSLNLLPVGQLDGGHILVSVFGEKVKRIFPFILIALVGLGFAWSGWWFWAALLFMLNRLPSQVYDSVTPLDKKRKLYGNFNANNFCTCVYSCTNCCGLLISTKHCLNDFPRQIHVISIYLYSQT